MIAILVGAPLVMFFLALGLLFHSVEVEIRENDRVIRECDAERERISQWLAGMLDEYR